MKKNLMIILFPAGLMAFVILMAGFGGSDLKYSGGAPAGYTNSPADGQNCSHCMGGTAVPVTGWITSNIPASGYVPGSTYTFTVTATGTGRKGFEVSPQDVSGTLIGTLTAGTGNELVGTKYVTHSSAQTGNPTTWNFQWTAPISGAGDVTFYGSIAVGKLNTKTTTLTVSQTTVGMAEPAQASLSVYPNPAHDFITVAGSFDTPGAVSLDLLNIRGELILNLLPEKNFTADFKQRFPVSQPAGLYFIRMSHGEKEYLSKVVIR
jgi:hypothetical protein